MTIKDFFSKFTGLYLWGNLLAMGIITIILTWGTLELLNIYTRHGQKIEVPDVRGLQLNDAKYKLERLGLECILVDSDYVRNQPSGSVLAQNPAKGSLVKEGRSIYITINARSTPTIQMPDIADNSSLRAAEVKLRALGFKLTPCEYVSGEMDWVYSVKCNGKLVSTGERIPIDMPLTLEVGDGTNKSTNQNDSIETSTPSKSEGKDGSNEGVDELFQ